MNFFATRRLKHFLATAFQTASYERFDGVPLERIDASWAERSAWMEGALTCFHAARSMRDRARYPLVVAISFALRPAGAALGVTFRDLAGLDRELDDTSPILTVYAPHEDGGGGHGGVVPVHVGIFGLEPSDAVRAELIEWRFEDDDPQEAWIRSVLLLSDPSSGPA